MSGHTVNRTPLPAIPLAAAVAPFRDLAVIDILEFIIANPRLVVRLILAAMAAAGDATTGERA